MMTREMMIATIENLGDDATLFEMRDGSLHVTIEDFGGFDDNWCETEREFDDENAVDEFIEMLEDECESQEGDLYTVYYFDGFEVKLGYASFDI